MATQITKHLYEFLARFATSGPDTGRIVGLQATMLDRVSTDGTVDIERTGATAPATYAEVAAMLHDDDLAALKSVIDAEIESRA